MMRKILTALLLAIFLLPAFTQEGDWTPKPPPEFPVEMDKISDWLWEQMSHDPEVKEHFGFKLAFCQHPMYLVIDEDRGVPTLNERIPPFGAATSPEYVERVKRNLESLERFPDIKINYQWSAYELNHMIEAFPEVHLKMKELYRSGSLEFIDGTYSQAHLQVLGSESNWRQFEYGLEVYRDHFGKNVDLYARQETGLHRQLPQLLKLFGYRYITLPYFNTVFEFNEGPLEITNHAGHYLPLSGQEFIISQGLDGSGIPTYLWSPRWHPGMKAQLEMDLISGPKIHYEFPDLVEVDQEHYDRYRHIYDWVLLDDALDERIQASPPTATASIYTYWSYLEGVWAEELMRNIKLAEETAVMAEQIQAMGSIAQTGVERSADIKDIWKEILKSQHHDISWIEVTDLRRKSIIRLKETRDRANGIMGEITTRLVNKDPSFVAIFNGQPNPRESLVELSGKRNLDGITFQEFNGRSTGFVNLPPGGFRSIREKGKPAGSSPGDLPETILAEGYQVHLDKSGLMRQITVNGKELLSAEDYLGGEIRARIDKEWKGNTDAEVRYYTGPVFDVVERTGTLGTIPVKERYYYFKKEPLIKVELDFEFHGDEVGNMWMDETKINVYYPTGGNTVHHDIPFGYTRARQDRPLFATNWISCGGIVFVNRGTIKHRVEDGVIANVLAWGSHHYTNRIGWDYWAAQAQYDIRLYGNHSLEYYIIPLESFDGNMISRKVTDLVSPVFITRGKGETSYYESGEKGLLPTSVYHEDGKTWMRGYKLPGEGTSDYRDWEIFNRVLAE